MLEILLLKDFLIAFLLGTLIGLEREYAQYKGNYSSFAGIRTFPLIALSGAVFAYFGKLISIWILLSGIIIFSSLIIVAYYSASIKAKYHGITTAMAALIAFFVGILSIYDTNNLAVIIAVITTILLYARTFLHHFAQRIEKKELIDTLKFIVIAFVILPFLPNKNYGPYGIFNPFLIWLMIVLISGISFIGYILMKWFKEKGMVLTGIFGGLVSSTMLTTSFAQSSKKNKHLTDVLILGVILANGIMFLRILVIVFAINRSLLIKMLLPMIILTISSIILAYLCYRKVKKHKNLEVNISSPLTLWPALKFGIFFALIIVVVKITSVYLSYKGIYAVSALSGIINADAITVSLSQLAKKELTTDIALKGILIATIVNIAVKGGIAYFKGSAEFSKRILLSFAIQILIATALII